MTTASYLRMLTTPCLVVRYGPGAPALSDEYGNLELVGSSTAGHCALQPTSSSEDPTQGDVQTSDWRCFLTADFADLTGADEVLIAGTTYHLTGDPAVITDHRNGRVHHVEAYVRRVV